MVEVIRVPSDQPTSFFEALKKKYASASAEEITATANEIHISGKTVEEVGFEKIRRQLAKVQELRIVVLDGACIAAVDSDLEKQNLKIIELDLSRNLLESWYEVTAICSSLHCLQSLRLEYVPTTYLYISSISAHLESYSGNTLSRPQDPFNSDESHGSYGQLKELSLNNLGFLPETATGEIGNLSWEFIKKFTAVFPSLTTLSLASNNLTDITLPLTTPLLTKLDLSSNAFTTLEHIRPLTALPNLQTLSLRANPLTSLSSPPDMGILFPKLKHLDLISTVLPTLSSLNPIPVSFPGLTSLLTNHTPLITYPSASLHTIARLATLTELNYSQITPPERQNAELYYLSQVSKQLAAVTDNVKEREVLEEHPRWKELCDIHGEPTIIRTNDADAADAGTLAARVTEFVFQISKQDLQRARKHAQSIDGHSGENTAKNDPGHDAPIVEKTKLIPRTVDVYRLKGIVGQLFSIRPMSVKLIWETEEWDPVGEGDGGWSVSEDESDEESRLERKDKRREKEMWKRREMELVDGTREVGFFVEGKRARVRVESR
ncbi:hypothetical protein HO133_002663 [Letharia lupina]|uniref:Uncharacterized protein n=1 Tax=Letharia lupina TaxID=560253 RepID=A0A8H6CCH4_9LECA|nr:uncharacterized protein HO133_002663 [Letharia lupina]KAF6220982.1 hypothetical protein HO133_002663 [Letharia lupina]